MTKYIFVLLLLVLNVSANKNWISFDDQDSSDKIQNQNNLKMYGSKSSLKAVNSFNETSKKQNTNTSDKDLINAFKQIQNVAKKLQAKIKK
mgnify:CR=1 FL=1